MIKCLLTEFGEAGRENIRHSAMAHDLEPNIFPFRHSHSVNI